MSEMSHNSTELRDEVIKVNRENLTEELKELRKVKKPNVLILWFLENMRKDYMSEKIPEDDRFWNTGTMALYTEALFIRLKEIGFFPAELKLDFDVKELFEVGQEVLK